MSDAPTQTFPDGARVRIKPLNLVGKIAGFAHVGCNGQMRVLVDRPHGQGATPRGIVLEGKFRNPNTQGLLNSLSAY